MSRSAESLHVGQALLDDVKAMSGEFVDIRRDIHAHPEMAFQEFRTSDLVAELLERFGYEVHRGLAGTGVIGTLKRGNKGRVIGIRADMDALPIQEQTGLEYSSKYDGVMHACGHDGHTAILLCAAKYIAENLSFDGTLHLIFQPAEENEGGALRMVDEGLFGKFPCEEVYALHNSPGIPVGKILVGAGARMAAFDRATITLRGKNSHGARPHEGIDPLQAAASIVLGLQSIIGREISAFYPVVITVGSLQAGEAYNVVPDKATLKLGIRSLDPEVREFVENRIKDYINQQATSFRLVADINYEHMYPMLINHEKESLIARSVAEQLVGAENVLDFPQTMGSEDFAYMLQSVPGSYVRIGNGIDAEGGAAVHTPKYNFNDAALPIAAAFWISLVSNRLG